MTGVVRWILNGRVGGWAEAQTHRQVGRCTGRRIPRWMQGGKRPKEKDESVSR